MIEIGANNPETIDRLSDVDGDGADDYLIGGQSTSGASGALVISGRTGQIGDARAPRDLIAEDEALHRKLAVKEDEPMNWRRILSYITGTVD